MVQAPTQGYGREKRQASSSDSALEFYEWKRGLPYPKNLRSKVISSIQAGRSRREIAAQYGVSVSTVGKWALRFHRTGSVAAKPAGGDRHRGLEGERDWLLGRVAADPGVTLATLHQELSARGIRVGSRSVERFLKKNNTELL
jgi:transposase